MTITKFKSRPDLSDIQFKQNPDSELNLSGDTRINKNEGLILTDSNHNDIVVSISESTTEGDFIRIVNNKVVREYKPNLSDLNFKQSLGSELNLSGNTRINKVDGFILTDENHADVPVIISGASEKDVIRYENHQLVAHTLEGNEIPYLDEDVRANVEVGGIWDQRLMLSGTSFTDFVKKLLITTYYPTFSASSFGFTTNLNGSNVEAGTNANVALTYSFNRGSINGLVVGGIWNPSTFQNYRAGSIVECIIDGTSVGTGLTLTRNPRLITDGTNTFNGSLQYAIGTQPLDSYGDPSDPNHDGTPDAPLAAGTSSLSTSIVGRRKAFYGISNALDSSASIRSLPSTFNLSTFTINIPIGATNVVFAYPATLSDVHLVLFVEFANTPVQTAFTKLADLLVEGAEGYTSILYKRYMFTPVSPFPTTATYNVII